MAISKKKLIELVRKSKNREVMSDFIRIGTSDLYDYDVTRRAVLREIAFLQQNDESKKTPEDSPFAHDYIGWCWASQRYIAARVGTVDDYVSECVKLFENDGVIRCRDWVDRMGYPHKEYQIIGETIEAHQRPEDYLKDERKRPRTGGNKSANSGSFKAGNKAAARKSHSGSQPSPTEFAAEGNRVDSRVPLRFTAVEPAELTAVSETAASPLKGVVNTEGVGSLRSPLGGFSSASTAASDTASSAPPAADAGREMKADSVALKTTPKEVDGSKPEKHKRPIGTVVKGTVKPLPNRLCYPEAFKHCYDADGKWKFGTKVPKCKRCGYNLQPEENHVCPGYIPQLPFVDMENHTRRMEAQREDHHELIANGSTSRHKPTCKRCGEPLRSEEGVEFEPHECQGYMSL